MENQYKKTFPDLMAGKKIIYVHGFMSAGSTHTAQILCDYMPQATVIAPDLPIHPEEAMELLRNLVGTEKPDLIIGTSMGGMYTEMLYGFDRICVNPAFQMGATLTESNMMGKQVYQNERQDGVQEVIVTKALVKEYRDMTEQCFSQVNEEEQQHVFGLFGDADSVVHTFDLFREHYPQAIRFHGEHRLIEKAIFHYLMPVVRWIDDRQEGRERRTVFIDQNTLADGYGKPKSSLHKAYEFSTTTTSSSSVLPRRTVRKPLPDSRNGSKRLSVRRHGITSSSPTSHSFFMATTSSAAPETTTSSEQHCTSAAMSSKPGKKSSLSLNAWEDSKEQGKAIFAELFS